MTEPRTILHVDLDAFYAAVEVRENPALAGKPVVVGADPRGGHGRGVVCAASYPARAFGIRSAMPISQAYRRCPHAVFLAPRMKLYGEVSRRFMAILRRYTDLVEPLSIDEAFLDVTASRSLFGDGEQIARRIKDEVRQEERITASIGVAPVKFVAKIASDLRKPDGLVVVEPQGVREFLAPLPVERLWGAGAKAVERFHRLGVRTIGEVAALEPARLREAFGEHGAEHFRQLALGVDPRAVEPEHAAKSIGREQTFAADVDDRGEVERTLLALVDQVAQRLRREDVQAESLTLKLRTADFVTVTRQATLAAPADTTDLLWPVAKQLLAKADSTRKAIRLIGVSAGLAQGPRQLGLFVSDAPARRRKVADAVDAVRARFGDAAIGPGTLVPRRRS